MDFYDIKHELNNLNFKRKTQFSGSTPPEIFIGKHDYPNIYSGILAPIEYGNTESFSKPVRCSPIRENSVPFIGNPAPLKNIRLEENPKIEKKVDYIVSDNKLKASQGI